MRETFNPDSWTVDVDRLVEARRRYMRAGYSAMFRCVETPGVGMRNFLDVADRTQRELVGRTAREFYLVELGIEEDNLEAFFGVTNVGVVGAGFDYEVNRYANETAVSAEQYRCPLIDHATSAGYPIGHEVYQDMSLWCDTYDNFESAAVATSVAMAHSHCLGKGDHQCRWYIEKVDPAVLRKGDEHIYDYLARMRDSYRAAEPGGPWVIDGLDAAEIDRITRENVEVSEVDQDKLYPTVIDKLEQGVLISVRIAASNLAIAASLQGWDTVIAGMEDKEGPILVAAARQRADQDGIYGFSPAAAHALHVSLNVATGVGPFMVEEQTDTRVVATSEHCPLTEAAVESGLGDYVAGLMAYKGAVATYEARAVSPDFRVTYTHCRSQGDDTCRYVIEKTPAAVRSGSDLAGALA